ncbi:M48 family metallopeptidase [Haloarcula sp. S1CR25-12]|uniref:M48 family metallopeptidase n=1 Tax=Haloarcula saliterrae TaxID=2950534 RepID=A0ABU2FJC0_9EURY|nr:SprT family zinc-dependent metalloprotease [Haloarcula sp. S1CR25-12]MDS0261886.1 M48 family metallopeptidase [Haloarcula sp. S1CR25-12]
MSEADAKRETSLAGKSVEYEIRRSADAAEPRIDVDIRGVQVTLPEDSEEDPDELLRENAMWVLEKKSKYDRHRQQAPDRAFEPGATFPYLGEDHTVVVEPGVRHDAVDGEIRLRQSAVTQSSLKQVLENFYRTHAREHLADRVDHYADEMGVEYKQIQLRNQRTLWGSCSTTGTLSLNWRLVMAPPEIIDYVVIHELAHLIEANHTQEFWRIVGEYEAEYKQHSEWLEANSTTLIFSEADL